SRWPCSSRLVWLSWAWMDLNHRPHPYQGCALTKLSYRPVGWTGRGPASWSEDTRARETLPIRTRRRADLRFRRPRRGCRGGWARSGRGYRRSVSVISIPPTRSAIRLYMNVASSFTSDQNTTITSPTANARLSSQNPLMWKIWGGAAPVGELSFWYSSVSIDFAMESMTPIAERML